MEQSGSPLLSNIRVGKRRSSIRTSVRPHRRPLADATPQPQASPASPRAPEAPKPAPPPPFLRPATPAPAGSPDRLNPSPPQ